MKVHVCTATLILLFFTITFSAFAEGEQEGTGTEPKWLQIQWEQPQPWAERLKGVELADQIPQEFIATESWLEDQPEKTAAVGGYVWPDGWEEAVEGVDSLSFFNFGGLPHDPAIGLAIAAFETKTGIEVKAQAMEELGLWLKTVAAMTAKRKEPELIQSLPLLSLTHIAAAGWAENLDFFWPEEVQKLYGEGTINSSMVDGHFWASGFVATTPFVPFYRPSILKEATGSPEPPKNYAELMEIGKQIAENTDYYPLAVPGKDFRNMFCHAGAVLYSMGGKYIHDGKYDVTTPEYKKMFTYMVNLLREGVIPKEALGWSWTDAPETFARGRAAMVLAGTVNATRWSDNPPAAIEGDWKFKPPLPWGEGDVGKTSLGTNASWSVNKFSDEADKAASMLFLDFYRSYQSQWNEIGFEGNECAIPAIYKMDSIQEAVYRPDLRSTVVDNSMGEALPINGEQMIKYQLEWWAKAGTGEVSIEEALENLAADIETVTP